MDQHDRERVRRAQWGAQVRAGAVWALDRFGRKLQIGHGVLYEPPISMLYKVLGVDPILDHNVPPGMLRVRLETTVEVPVQAGAPILNLCIVSELEGAGAGADVPDQGTGGPGTAEVSQPGTPEGLPCTVPEHVPEEGAPSVPELSEGAPAPGGPKQPSGQAPNFSLVVDNTDGSV